MDHHVEHDVDILDAGAKIAHAPRFDRIHTVPLFEQMAQLPDRRIESLDVSDHEDRTAPFRRADQPPARGFGRRQRLLDQTVNSVV